jgi:tetratricopeptide (TPR) repeat protein
MRLPAGHIDLGEVGKGHVRTAFELACQFALGLRIEVDPSRFDLHTLAEVHLKILSETAWYRNSMVRWYLATVAVFLVPASIAAQFENFDQTVELVEELSRGHRYQQVLDLLLPLEGRSENLETQYIIAAELGRAYFHLGRYSEAHPRLRLAVSVHPERIESALYLQATSFLLGDRVQALLILQEVLRSGARDLYPAVTLPGERGFLGDPEVWQLLEEHAETIPLDPAAGRFGEIGLDSDRSTVLRVLGAPSNATSGDHLVARAGPHPIWSCAFSDTGILSELVLYNENLAKYTPYRLGVASMDWRLTPAQAINALGPPEHTEVPTEEGVEMKWAYDHHSVSMVFGYPRAPRPPDVPDHTAMLLLVRLADTRDAPAGDSGSMSQ